uniref:Uncharacterized protein n=1 Tax=Anguilla anguilla TaxID=7936 RepID=A0A0E9S4Y5_ANGAN
MLSLHRKTSHGCFPAMFLLLFFVLLALHPSRLLYHHFLIAVNFG